MNTTDTLVSADYYARRQTGTCESDDSLKITVNIKDATTPTSTSLTQEFCKIDKKRVSDLDPNGADINWYKVSDPGVKLNVTDTLVSADYYARRQTGTCESDDSLKITVILKTQLLLRVRR